MRIGCGLEQKGLYRRGYTEWGYTNGVKTESIRLRTSPGIGDERDYSTCSVFDVFILVALFRLIPRPYVLVSVLTGLRLITFDYV